MTESTTIVELGGRRYQWLERSTAVAATNDWSHHGMVVAPDGVGFVAATPDGRAFVRWDGDVALRSEELGVSECHGMSVDAFDDEYSIWVADNGTKSLADEYGNQVQSLHPGQVIRATIDGTILQRIDSELLPHALRNWRPTGVTSEPASRGGRMWVADGYGTSHVHCFSREGELLWSSDGSDSGLAFACPHAIVLDTRRDTHELLVADRTNTRIVVLDLDGKYLRSFGEGHLTSPSGFAIDGERLWVTELFGSVVVFDLDGVLLGRWGSGEIPTEPGWPNTMSGKQILRPPAVPGVFRSPHGIAANALGVIAISEWVVGGRIITLSPIR